MSRIVRNNERKPLTMPIIGKVKVGEVTEKGYPKSTDYFLPYGQFAKELSDTFIEKYGTDKPNKIEIFFPDLDESVLCYERLELRGNDGKLIAYTDGVTFHVNEKVDKHTVITKEIKPDDAEKFKEQLITKYSTDKELSWTETLTLRFMIVGFNKIGLWEYTTKGKETSIPSIVGTFDTIKNIAHRISFIPFQLCVNKHTSNKAGSSNQYPVVEIICDLSDNSLLTLAEYQGNLVENLSRGLLTDNKIQQYKLLVENNPNLLTE